MAPNQKANYKSYEAQARLVRAMVAAHPEVKWNYKDICRCYGSDMSEHALNHRFRPIRSQSKIVRDAVKKGKDASDIPIDEKEIAKYYGESTGDGMQFQFRAVKKDAQSMKDAVDRGENPRDAVSLGTGSGPGLASTLVKSTPAKPRRSASIKTKKLHRGISPLSLDEDESDEEAAWEGKDTPTKSRSRVQAGRITKPGTASAFRTPARAATAAAAATVSSSVDLTASESEVETPVGHLLQEDIKPVVPQPEPATQQPARQPVGSLPVTNDPFAGVIDQARWMGAMPVPFNITAMNSNAFQPLDDDNFQFGIHGTNAFEDEV